MRAGVLVSAAAHLALLALVVRGLPWLRPHAEATPPAMQVSLLTAAELAAAEAAVPPAAATRAQPAPTPMAEPSKPQPAPAATAPAATGPAATEHARTDDEPLGDLISLAPAFDPARPLGLAGPADVAAPATPAPAAATPPDGAPLRTSGPPRPRPASAATAALAADAADLRAGLAAGVRRALAKAQAYPEAARRQGIAGAATVSLTMTRAGKLVTARLAASSGSAALDAASLAAARDARYPPAPDALPGSHFTFDVRLDFAP